MEGTPLRRKLSASSIVSIPTRDKKTVSRNVNTNRHDHLIAELEASDSCLGNILKSIYDEGEHGAFMEKLESHIQNHDRDIEKMCNYHYQGFIDSVTELLKLRSDADKLKNKVVITNRALQQSGGEVVTKVEDLMRCLLAQKNINEAIESLSSCIPVLDLYQKLKEQIRVRRYYPALKTLEQLEHTYLPQINKYKFAVVMKENIPKLRENIKEASMSDLKDFLESIRKHSEKVGERAMQQRKKQIELERDIASGKTDPISLNPSSKARSGTARSDDGSTSPFQDEQSNPFMIDEDEEEEVSAQDLVDFSPVYRCVHIYTVLGERDFFEQYYRTQRRKQARLALGTQGNTLERLEGYKTYFNQIVGFFVVEDHILHTTQGLVTKDYLTELWDLALSKIMVVLRTHSAYCTDPNLLLDIKNLIVLFSQTLEGYGFPVVRLFDLLVEISDQYNEMLMNKWMQLFTQIFEEDNYTPITVETEKRYTAITTAFPLHDAEELEKAPFPKTFFFSAFVPRVYRQVKEFIYAILKFTEDLNLSCTEKDDMVRKSTNLLLTRTLSGCLSRLVCRPQLGLTELVQISINMTHLEESCAFLEEFISNITGSTVDNAHVAKLHGTSTFKDAQGNAEQQIYQKLNQKIDEFLDLANNNWTISEATGHASGYIMDLVAFLKSTFLSFTNLPGKVAQTACMSACKHLASSLMRMLIDPDVKQISLGALAQFNLDVIQCEAFTSCTPVPGFQDEALQMTFIDLRQLLDLVTEGDWPSYFADYGKPSSEYLRVNPQSAIIILEKMKDLDKKRKLLTTFKKDERDRKKLQETVLKQLKSLVNSGRPG